jgi:hypothetical protein
MASSLFRLGDFMPIIDDILNVGDGVALNKIPGTIIIFGTD